MKKLIGVTLFIIIYGAAGFCQQEPIKFVKGLPAAGTRATYKIVGNESNDTYGPLPVELTQEQLDSSRAVKLQSFPGGLSYAEIQNSRDWTTFNRGATDTVGTVPDTLSRKLVSTTSNSMFGVAYYWWQGHISADDTIQVSTEGSFLFPDIILPNQLTPLPKSVTTNLYLKVYGTGTPRYYVTVWGK